jgi:glycosyltransferase involved in cell wall biosynthesis
MIDGDRYPPASTTRPTRLRIALAHDWLVGYRGGEMVLDALARMLSREHEIVGVYTMFADGRAREKFPSAKSGLGETGEKSVRDLWDAELVRTSTLGRVPGALKARRWLLPMYPLAVAGLSKQLAREHARRPIDLVISTSSAAIKNLRVPDGVKNVCYCHAPARYLWSQADAYASGSGGGARKIGLAAFGNALRTYDRRGSDGVHAFIANSAFIARQIQEHYGRSSTVVHPPVRTEFFIPNAKHARDGAPASTHVGARKPWLYVGALEPYKRVDLAIGAAVLAKRELVIVGSGSQLQHVKQEAQRANERGAKIEVQAGIDDDALRELYRSASLLLFPQIEDFGIVSVEAQACGLPVVARGAGGALDTVIDGVTGVLVHDDSPPLGPTAESFAHAAKRCEELALDLHDCRRNAEAFSIGAFEARVRAVLSSVHPAFGFPPRSSRSPAPPSPNAIDVSTHARRT